MGYSLGFWLEHDDKESPSEEKDFKKNIVELHINYWSLESKEKFHYLDIGIKLQIKNKNLQAINFYLPFKLTQDDYMASLGQVICSKDDLLELIFNEKLEHTSTGSNYKDVKFLGKNNECLRIYEELDSGEDNVEFRLDDDSTRIIFSNKLIHSFDEDKNENSFHYLRFRLRLNLDNVKKLSQNYEPQDRLVVSKFEKIEITDFRLNELRDLPGSVCNVLNKGFILKGIHFFLIRDIHDELKLAHTDYKRCRLLEKKVWEDYLVFSDEPLVVPNQMLIYHFKEVKDNEEHLDRFNAFAKFKRVKISIISLLIFLCSVIILGALGSLMATLLIESRPSDWSWYTHLKHKFVHWILLFLLFFPIPALIVYLFCRDHKFSINIQKKS